MPRLMILMLATVALATGCSSSASETARDSDREQGASADNTKVTFPLTIKDAAGKSHTFDQPVKAFGCWWLGCTETLADLGIVPHAAAGTKEELASPFLFPGGPPPSVVRDDTNVEDWAKSGVDVIIADGPGTPDSDSLEPAAPVFYLNYPPFTRAPKGLEGWRENYELLAQLAGKPELADAAIKRFDTFIAALREKAPAGSDKLVVLPLYSSDDNSYSALGTNDLFCLGVVEAGIGRCPDLAHVNAESAEVSAEAVLKSDPDWIVYSTFGAADDYAKRDDAVWKRLRAVKAGQVFNSGYPSRTFCCSLRGVEHALQDYAQHAFPDAGIPPAGKVLDFDPTKNLLQ